MDEQEARFALLQGEISAIESSVRSFDTIAFQVKGWCVTVSLAIAGLALNRRRELIVLGAVAVIGFWLVDSQNRAIQRVFLNRSATLRDALRRDGLTEFLNGAGPELSVGSPELKFVGRRPGARSIMRDLPSYARLVFFEAFHAHTLSLYLLLLVSLGVEAAVV